MSQAAEAATAEAAAKAEETKVQVDGLQQQIELLKQQAAEDGATLHKRLEDETARLKADLQAKVLHIAFPCFHAHLAVCALFIGRLFEGLCVAREGWRHMKLQAYYFALAKPTMLALFKNILRLS